MNINMIALPILALVASAAVPAVPEKGGDVTAGQTVFAAKCATCHAKDGKGNAAMAKMFKVESAKLDLTSEEAQKKPLADIVTNGIKGTKMASFKDKLKGSDIANVVAYVHSLGVQTAPK